MGGSIVGQRVAQVVEEVIRRRSADERVIDEEVIAAHPELMPELAEKLRALRQIERAEQRAWATAVLASGSSVSSEVGGGAAQRIPSDSLPGYELIGEIHRGGQGVVYRAVQKATRREVAIKVVREGPFLGPRDKARFDPEVRVLARLKHPNIVTIHDSGIAAGNHYFVMDCIRGRPLDAHLADRAWSLEETLRLFAKICEAVNAAHLRGVIHRDLKPGNILIDQRDEPHVLDFGLAKIATEEIEDATQWLAMTMTGQFVGSLPWASPGQAEGVPDKIDIRTDVYSLGVILYQMLTGGFPYEVVGNMRDVLDNILKAEPAKPSAIRRQINDEVETIVLTCLQKQRERRYQTAGELGRDIQHYLAGEPIEAKRDSGWYVLRKTLRRFRIPVAIAATFVLLLGASSVVSTTLWRQAAAAERSERLQRKRADRARDAEAEQRRLAEAAEREQNRARREAEAARAAEEEQWKLAEQNERKAKDNEALALKRAEQTMQVTEFQASMLSGIDAEQMGRTIIKELRKQVRSGLERTWVDGDDGRMRKRTADEVAAGLAQFEAAVGPANPTDVARQMMDTSVLTPAVAAITEDFGSQPEVQAQLLDTLGRVYQSLGQYDQAEPHLRRALDLQRRMHGDEHANVGTSLRHLASLLDDKGDYTVAESLSRETLALYRKLLGDEHPDVATGLNNLAGLLYRKGDYAAAEPLYREALGMQRKLLGDQHPDVATGLNNLGLLLKDRGDYAAAEPLLREALALRRKLSGDGHPRVALSLNSLAALLHAKGHYATAEPLVREALALDRKLLGDEHPRVALSLNNLAGLLYRKGDYAAAEPLYRDALAVFEEKLPPAHEYTANVRAALGRVLTQLSRYAEAEALLLAAQETYAQTPAASPRFVRRVFEGLVELYDAWDAAKPGQGYDANAAEWRAMLPEEDTQPRRHPGTQREEAPETQPAGETTPDS